MTVGGDVENEKAELTAEILQTDEEIAQCMIKWKPYLAYVDDLISKALIQAASTRYRALSIPCIKLIVSS